MYQVGEMVFYGNTGVCRIENIALKSLPGVEEEKLYYTLLPVYDQCVIHAPVDSDKVFMRPVISREDALRLIDLIPSIRARPYHSKMVGGLVEHYRESINSHSCGDLLELTMSIYAKKQELADKKRSFGAVDGRFLRHAEELLFGELAVALGIEKEEVPAYIAQRVEAAEKTG